MEAIDVSARYSFLFVDRGSDAVFPIIRVEESGLLTLVGTGFFILPGGIFLTARHVVQGNHLEPNDSLVVLQQSGTHVTLRDVARILPHPIHDLAAGVLTEPHDECQPCAQHPFVSIMRLQPEENEVIGTYAFPRTEIDEPVLRSVNGSEEDWYQRILYRATWHTGRGLTTHPEGLGLIRGPCYRVRMVVEGGASGGPTVNSNGFVFGLNSTGINGQPDATISSLEDSSTSGVMIDGIPLSDMIAAFLRENPITRRPMARMYRLND